MIVLLRTFALVVAMGFGSSVFAQVEIQQRQQYMQSIQNELTYLNSFLTQQSSRLAYASDYISRNAQQMEARLMNIRAVERDIGQAIDKRNQAAATYNAVCAPYWQQNLYCQTPQSVQLGNFIQSTDNFIENAHQTRNVMIQKSNALFNDFYRAQADIQQANITIGQLQARRQTLETALSNLQALPPGPMYFDFSQPESKPGSPAAPSTTIDPKQVVLEAESKKTLAKFDATMTATQQASAKVDAVLSATRGTLENVKRTLKGTPASELDFGNF